MEKCGTCNGAGCYDPGDLENGPRLYLCTCGAGQKLAGEHIALGEAKERAEYLIELLYEHDEHSADGFADLLTKNPTLDAIKDYIGILEMTLGAYMEVPTS